MSIWYKAEHGTVDMKTMQQSLCCSISRVLIYLKAKRAARGILSRGIGSTGTREVDRWGYGQKVHRTQRQDLQADLLASQLVLVIRYQSYSNTVLSSLEGLGVCSLA